MREILPGVWHWSAEHPKIHRRVSSYWLPESATVLDPLLGPDGPEDLAGLQRIVLTCRHHRRSAPELRERFGATVLVPRSGLHEFEGDTLEVEPYEPGDEVAPGVVAHALEAISPDDEVLHLQAGPGALAFSDGLIRMQEHVGFVPDSLMDDPPAVKARTRERVRELLDELEFDALLFAHGDPLPSGGRAALEAFLRTAG